MEYERIIFSGHAVRQMFSRGIAKNDVLAIIEHGQIIIEYPHDKPYPSRLMLGFMKDVPVHVVFAIDKEQRTGIVITAYIPDPHLWSENFKSRRNK
ncbi:MAG: DUF4258 domain-containing protein [Sedimentisphaerales bacterium]